MRFNIDIRHFSFPEMDESGTQEKQNLIFAQLSTINYQLLRGGIAQLVERQLCKLEVRGSNPLASKACKAWRQNLTTREHYRLH
jgi:hypothetical protein